jgi:hypothetical protein
VFLSVGHDEYWSGPQRAKVETARDERGVNLCFFSGNEVYWRIRWEPSHVPDVPASAGEEREGLSCGELRSMICYKESHASQRLDPKRDEWTGVWRDGRQINPLGPQPENSLTGQVYTVGMVLCACIYNHSKACLHATTTTLIIMQLRLSLSCILTNFLFRRSIPGLISQSLFHLGLRGTGFGDTHEWQDNHRGQETKGQGTSLATQQQQARWRRVG